jgi:hypothetical protein
VTPAQDLDRRSREAGEKVRLQRVQVRQLRLRSREDQAASAVVVDVTTVIRLRARGLLMEPPIPSHVPDDLC